MKKIAMLIICFFCLIGFVHAEDTIKVGAIFAKSGKGATSGELFFVATRFAIDEINEKGGWFGKRIELLEFDNESTPLGSKNAAKKAIQENVSAVIGASWSSNSLAAAPVLQQAGIPMITPASTNPKVTTVGHCIFRIPFLDSFQGVVMADFAIFELKAKTASILINVDNQYSTGLAEIFINRFKEQGGKILSKGNYLQDAANFTPLLKQVKELNPEVTFVPGYPRDSALIIKQARKMAVTTIFLGGDGWSDRMYEYAGEELSENYYSASWHRDTPNQESRQLLKKFEAKQGILTRAAVPLTYDAVMLLDRAVRNSNSFQPSTLCKEIGKIKNFKGATGIININDNGDPVKPAFILKLGKTRSEYVSSYSAKK